MYKYNSKNLKPYRKKLRNKSTSAEAILWNLLKQRKCGGLKFRRQYSIGKFIVDFYCPEIRLAIELDGEDHYWQAGIDKDKIKSDYIDNQGITILRFENKWVFQDHDYIMNSILACLNSTTPAPDTRFARSGATPPVPGGEISK